MSIEHTYMNWLSSTTIDAYISRLPKDVSPEQSVIDYVGNTKLSCEHLVSIDNLTDDDLKLVFNLTYLFQKNVLPHQKKIHYYAAHRLSISSVKKVPERVRVLN